MRSNLPPFDIHSSPGSGKSHLFNRLKQVTGCVSFLFFEGPDIIAKHVLSPLEAFEQLPEDQKTTIRGKVIRSIMGDCVADCNPGVITGHCMFWSDPNEQDIVVCTPQDPNTYTHILYLDIPAKVIAKRCHDDSKRSHSSSFGHCSACRLGCKETAIR